MAKRVYLAGPWVDREKVTEIADILEGKGYKLTHKWWKYEGEGEHLESKEFLQNCAYHDVDGVRFADVVVVMNTAKSEGKAVEQGLAIAFGKPVICWTPGDTKPSSNIFHHLPNYTHVKTLEAVLEVLGE